MTVEVEGASGDPYVHPQISGWRSHLLYIKITGWWCAFQLSQTALSSVVWPSQIEAIIHDESKKDLYNGFIPVPGAFINLIVTPIFGVMSDYYETRFGKRMPFIFLGSVIMLVLTICMAPFSEHSKPNDVFVLMMLICVYQFGCQVAELTTLCRRAILRLLPDLVHKDRIGIASGWLGVGLAVGAIIGSLGAGFLVGPSSYWGAYIFVAALAALSSVLTIFGIKEIPRPLPANRFTMKEVWSMFNLDHKRYKSFYWVIVTRNFYDMGIYMILPYLTYFLEDVMGLKSDDASLMSSITLAIIILVSIPASLSAGALSDRVGRKNLVYFSSGVMAVGGSLLMVICQNPSLPGTFIVGSLLGAGYGCYTAVDWAIAIDCLPPGAKVAKDLGIWHLSIVLPQVIGPLIAGGVLDSTKRHYNNNDSYSIFFAVIVMWFLLAFGFTYFIDVPTKPAPKTITTDLSESSDTLASTTSTDTTQSTTDLLPHHSSAAITNSTELLPSEFTRDADLTDSTDLAPPPSTLDSSLTQSTTSLLPPAPPPPSSEISSHPTADSVA